MDVAALVISILALLSAVTAAVYTASYARTAKRSLQLESEPHLMLERTRSASVTVPGKATVGGAVILGVRNHGKAPALSVKITDPSGKTHVIGRIDAGKMGRVVVKPVSNQTYTLAWMTVDQKKHRRQDTLD